MTHKDFAQDIAEKAGAIIRANFTLGMSSETKSDGSPVTKTDLEINSLVIAEVKKYFPEHAVLGEEESSPVEGADYVWVCDPIDGTIPFTRGQPLCAFSLALVHKGAPILGVAYDPFMDRLALAEKGQGAFLNGRPLCVSKKAELEGAYLSHCIWPQMLYPTPGFIDAMIFEKKTQNFAVGSIVYNGVLLAAGQLEGITFGHNTAHDVAAVKIIVEEAGGKVTDFWGNEQRYDMPIKGCLISNGILHEQLLAEIQKYLRPI